MNALEKYGLKRFKITYFMHPYEDIEFIYLAKTEEEAIVFAKNYRQDAFEVHEVMNDE